MGYFENRSTGHEGKPSIKTTFRVLHEKGNCITPLIMIIVFICLYKAFQHERKIWVYNIQNTKYTIYNIQNMGLQDKWYTITGFHPASYFVFIISSIVKLAGFFHVLSEI